MQQELACTRRSRRDTAAFLVRIAPGPFFKETSRRSYYSFNFLPKYTAYGNTEIIPGHSSNTPRTSH